MYAYREELKLRGFKSMNNNVAEARYMVHTHWHDAYEVLYVRRGVCEQSICDERFIMRPGEMAIIAPLDTHATSAISPDGCDIAVVQFEPGFLPGCRVASAHIPAQQATAWRGVADALDAAAQARSDTAGYLMGAGAIYAGLGAVLNAAPELVRGVGETMLERSVRALLEGCRYELRGVAARLGYAPEYLSRRIRAETGRTFASIAGGERMRRALDMLVDGRISVAQVAQRLGYADQSSFARAFRAHYGLSPREYVRVGVPLNAKPFGDGTGGE